MLSQFDNLPVYGRLLATLEPEAGLPNRLLDLFAARGVLPLAIDFRIDRRRNEARLRVDAVMGEQDWAILCARAAGGVGVLRFEHSTAALEQQAA